MNTDYYSLLGVSRQASAAEIKLAYRAMVKKYHPDLNPDGAAEFAKITAAYTVLKNHEKRQEYDKKGSVSHERKNLTFAFREFKAWLFGLEFLKSLFGLRKLSSNKTHAASGLDNDALLQRVLYSANPHVRVNAVKALFAKNEHGIRRDLLRLLYSELPFEIKKVIVHLTIEKPDKDSLHILDNIASSDKDSRLSRLIRSFRKIKPVQTADFSA